MNTILQYVINWLQGLKREPHHVLRKLQIAARASPPCKESLARGRNALHDRLPWITFEAQGYMMSVLRSNALVFEYGSGGSTLFYTKMASHVVSVEHDPEWYKRVAAALLEEGITNCEYLLVEPEVGGEADADPSDPQAYLSTSKAHSGCRFFEYAAAIERYPDDVFDLIAVDGRARPPCLYHARRKVRPGGYLLLDNSDREDYRKAKQLLADWEHRDFWGPGLYNLYFWQTTVWERPGRVASVQGG